MNTMRVLERAVAGLAGGVLGAVAMNEFAQMVDAIRGGREAAGAAPGDDRYGRGVQPPQAEGEAGDDATIRTARPGFRIVTGRAPDRRTERWLGTAAHLAFGAGVGLAYALLSMRMPGVRAAYGLPYGAAVWIAADEGLMPALGLSRGPRALTPGVHVYALLGHFAYAATLEGVLRQAEAATKGIATASPGA